MTARSRRRAKSIIEEFIACKVTGSHQVSPLGKELIYQVQLLTDKHRNTPLSLPTTELAVSLRSMFREVNPAVNVGRCISFLMFVGIMVDEVKAINDPNIRMERLSTIKATTTSLFDENILHYLTLQLQRDLDDPIHMAQRFVRWMAGYLLPYLDG